jgi:hypothetical protein
LFSFLDPKKAFWKWFEANGDRLRKAPVGPGAEFHELSRRLRKVHPELCFELGGAPDQPRQLVISAAGDRAIFHVVEDLVDRAPKVPGWVIVRFKPREPNYARHSISLNDLNIGPEKIRFNLLAGWDQTGLQFQLGVDLFIDGCTREGEEEFVGAAFILLDGALGEYDVTMKMGRLRVLPGSAAPASADRWQNFVAMFDEAFEDLTAQAASRAAARHGKPGLGK